MSDVTDYRTCSCCGDVVVPASADCAWCPPGAACRHSNGLRLRLLPVLDHAVERDWLTREDAFRVLDAIAQKSAAPVD